MLIRPDLQVRSFFAFFLSAVSLYRLLFSVP